MKQRRIIPVRHLNELQVLVILIAEIRFIDFGFTQFWQYFSHITAIEQLKYSVRVLGFSDGP